MSKIIDSEALGRVIRRERKRQQVTQVELAAMAGVGVRFLRELEFGKESCQLGRAFVVLNALGICMEANTRER